jgi:hypothetical protein
MPAKHDYVCNHCKHFIGDQYTRPSCTECGSGDMEITYSNWTKGIAHTDDERCNSQGYIKAFNCTDDPVVSMELGLAADPGNRVRILPRDVAMGLAEKMVKDGNTAKMRREVLEARKKYER